jgi:hypothetical protein
MKCPHFTTCSAPLCADDSTLEKAIWYPGEEICKRSGITITTVQRRIVRVGIVPNTCFTVSMLLRKVKVSKGLRGLDPERPRAEALESWLRQHKGVTPLSEVERTRRRDLMMRLKGPDSSKPLLQHGLPRVYPVSGVELSPASVLRVVAPRADRGQ